MQKITPFLWFDTQAEEAARYYVSVFRNSKLGAVSRYGESAAKAGGRPAGSVMTAEYYLDGQKFVALNGGPAYKLNEAISFVVSCETQAEIDHYWDKLAAGGAEVQCGWLRDRFGLSWQIVPSALPRLMQGKKADKVMAALMTMKKLDLAALERAAA